MYFHEIWGICSLWTGEGLIKLWKVRFSTPNIQW